MYSKQGVGTLPNKTYGLLFEIHFLTRSCSLERRYWVLTVLVCIFDVLRKANGGKHWFSEREHIKLWYFENLKEFWCIPSLSSCMERFRQKASFSAIFCWRQHFFKKIFPIKWHGWLAYFLRKSHEKFQTCSFRGKKLWCFY